MLAIGLLLLAATTFGAHPHHRSHATRKLRRASKKHHNGKKRVKPTEFTAVFDTGSSGTKPRLLMTGGVVDCKVDGVNAKNYLAQDWYDLINGTDNMKIVKADALNAEGYVGKHWSKEKLLEIPAMGITAILDANKRFDAHAIPNYIKELKRWCLEVTEKLVEGEDFGGADPKVCERILSGSTAGCRKSGQRDECKPIWTAMKDAGMRGLTLAGTEEALLEYLGFLDGQKAFTTERMAYLPSMFTMGGASAQMVFAIKTADDTVVQKFTDLIESFNAICKKFISVPPYAGNGYVSIGIQKEFNDEMEAATHGAITDFGIISPENCGDREDRDVDVLSNYIQKVNFRYYGTPYQVFVMSFLSFGGEATPLDADNHIYGGADSINEFILKKLQAADNSVRDDQIPSGNNNYEGKALTDIGQLEGILLADQSFALTLAAAKDAADEYAHKNSGAKLKFYGSKSPNMFFKQHPVSALSRFTTAQAAFEDNKGRWGCGWQYLIMKNIGANAEFIRADDTFDFTCKFADIYLKGHWTECHGAPAKKF